MSSVTLNRRIHKFIDGKTREHPELRKDVDELIEDLAREGRSSSLY